MADKEEMHTLIAKAAASKTFRSKLVSDPAKAASSIGIELDNEQLGAFKNASERMKSTTLDLRVRDTQAALLAVWI